MQETEQEFLDVALDNIADGVAAEYFDKLMDKIKENVLDPNTPWKTKREITLKLVFEPNEERDRCTVTVKPSCKLAAIEGHAGRIALGFVSGTLTARTIPSSDQQALPFTPKLITKAASQ